jgi:murein DD-endopeptidase MepM/ murein hydrolase activator NlpD
MQSNLTGRRLLGALLALLIVGTSALSLPASAQQEERLREIERRQGELESKIDRAKERRGQLVDRIGVVDDARSEVEDQVGALDAELAALNDRVDRVSQRLAATQQKLAVLHSELEAILARLVERTDIFTERAVAAYKAGPTAYLDGIFAAETFGDVVQRYAYYQSMLDADSQLIEEIEVLRAETDERRRQVERKEEEIAKAKRRLEKDRARVAEIRAERANALAALKSVLSEKKTLLAGVEAKKSRWERIQNQLDRESDNIRTLLAQRTSASPTTPAPSYGGGQFAWPAPGPVTSPYGYRTHPIFGGRRLHTGVDIGAPYGATVVAAASGVVAYVGSMSGYGNVVVVDHGGGIATTYNHLSGFAVSSGQRVSRSQAVASVGCTGYCTGPHLHFEVRIGGSPVDPMPYLQ